MNGRNDRLRSLVFIAVLAMGPVLGFLTAAAISRYGGVDGLMLRIRTEVAAHRPHPQFVPTPLPVLTGSPGSWRAEDDVPAQEAAVPSDGQVTLHKVSVVAPTQRQIGETTSGRSPDAAGEAASVSPMATSIASVALVPVHQPAPASTELSGFSHMWQTWNNCGPATLAMALSHFGIGLDQADVAAVLKPNRDDKNVSPQEIADFAQAHGLNGLVRVNGDSDLLRLLLSNGVPVLVETWLEPEPGDGMGHYRLLTGYNDATRQWTLFDSYVSIGVDPDQPYRGIHDAYDEVESLWTVFNHTYIVIYNDDQVPLVRGILGQDFDSESNWQRALQQTRSAVEERPDDPFAWFNLGSDLVALERFEEAASAYDRARLIGLPWRMLWYQFGPFRAYYETGRYQELIALADATIKAAGGNIEELYYWKGLGLIAQGDIEQGRQAWQRAIELNPNYTEAAAALEDLDGPGSQGRRTEPKHGAGGDQG
jgi:tetratricopeptide (TPR) repeat protein